MKTMLYCLTLIILCGSMSLSMAQSEGWKESWQDLQGQYFSKLDFRVPEERLKEIPQYSLKLSLFANMLEGKLQQGEIQTQTDQEIAGLVLIYDALLIMSNNKGIKEGVFELEDFKRLRAYAPTGSSHLAEMKARAEYSVREFVVASKLRPNDQRINSWLAGAKQGVLMLENGDQIPETSLREALDAIPLRPTFNLWTAILLFRSQGAETAMYEELALAGKSFVDHLRGSENPCQSRPEDCLNGPNAKFNIQSSMVTLADTFLRRGEYLLKTGDFAEALELLSYSKGTYEQLYSEGNIKNTQAWPDQDVIAERSEYINEMLRTRKPRKILLHQTTNFARPYECASCHGR